MDNIEIEAGSPPLQSFSKFLRGLGVSKACAWRWRQRGWLTTTNINGKVYISAEAIAEFKRRAESGEFAKKATTPKNRRAA
jgi:hypothetical protein